MSRPVPKCASCWRFPLTRENGGNAMCSGWEELRTWSDSAAACVLYLEVKSDEREDRARIVRELADQPAKEDDAK